MFSLLPLSNKTQLTSGEESHAEFTKKNKYS